MDGVWKGKKSYYIKGVRLHSFKLLIDLEHLLTSSLQRAETEWMEFCSDNLSGLHLTTTVRTACGWSYKWAESLLFTWTVQKSTIILMTVWSPLKSIKLEPCKISPNGHVCPRIASLFKQSRLFQNHLAHFDPLLQHRYILQKWRTCN